MGMRNMLILNKDNKRYLCRIADYSTNSSKIKLQVLGEENIQYCNIFQNDVINVEIPMGEKFSYFQSKVLYRDKIDHYIVIEKPNKGMTDNRRENKRIDVHMKLKITYGNEEVERSEALMGYRDSNAIIFDISYGGIGILTSYHFKKDDELIFSFRLPNGEILEDVKGFIISASHSDYENINKYGIKFEELTERQRIYLEEFITKYTDTKLSTPNHDLLAVKEL